jgi:cytochrome P450
MSGAGGLPPGPRAGRVRQTVAASRDLLGYLERCSARYGPVFTLRTIPFPRVVAVTSADLIDEVFAHPALVGGHASELVTPVLGRDSVIVATGTTHLAQRRTLAPGFHGRRLHRWAEDLVRATDEELRRVPDGRTPMVEVFNRIVFRVTARIVLGTVDPVRRDEIREAIAAVTAPAFQVQFWAAGLQRDLGPWSPWGRFLRRRAALDRLLFAEIAAASPDDEHVLATLLHTADREDPAQRDWLRDQLLTLVIAGHEATATALAWSAERLARGPELRSTLRDAVAASDHRALECFVLESLRWAPAVFDAVRTAQDDVELGGHVLPAGTMVSAMVCLGTRDPAVWDRPDEFLPERFVDTRRHRGWTPFGGGARRCLGAPLAMLELRAIVATMLAVTEISTDAPTEARRVVGVQQVPRLGAVVDVRRRRGGPLADDEIRAIAELAVRAGVADVPDAVAVPD